MLALIDSQPECFAELPVSLLAQLLPIRLGKSEKSPQSSLMLLPQELIESILFELDAESLRVCALLSSQFLSPSQRLIFRALVIHYEDISKAQTLFATAPRLSDYVHHLQIKLEASLQMQNGLLASILTSFHHLDSLSVDGIVEWKDLLLPLQSAIHNLLSSSNLHSLALSGIRDIPCSLIVLAMSSVRRLVLEDITVDTSEISQRPVLQRMEELSLRKSYPDASLTDLLLPGSDNLRRLTLGMQREIQDQSLRLVASAARTLRHLQLRCGVFAVPLDLPHLLALHVIELKVYFARGVNSPPNLSSAIAGFPTLIPNVELFRLTIFREWMPTEDKECWAEDVAGPLPLFDDTRAAYLEALPRLRRVQCHLWEDEDYMPHTIHLDHDQMYANFSAYIHRKLPALVGTDVLTISVGADPE
ncbi:hypothetical protein C8R47DRAFT_1286040 [Mycena vitilis]|nr:hypothetical protein C8R47DRAFT_1286040 [Mycena vitilis]